MTDIAAEKAGIAKPDVPLVTQLYPPAVAGRIGKAAHGSGAPWLPRGGSWDAIVRQSQLHYRDEQGELRLPLPRLPGRHQAMNAALAVAMLRHQEALRVPISALSAAMGWADWPARLQHLAPGPLVGKREVLARRRPQSGGRAPGSRVRQTAFQRRDAAARHLCEPDDQGPGGNAGTVQGPGGRGPRRADPRSQLLLARRSRRRRGRARLQRRRARGRRAGSGGYPERGSSADFRLALPCRLSPRRERTKCRPRLSRARRASWRQRRAGLPR